MVINIPNSPFLGHFERLANGISDEKGPLKIVFKKGISYMHPVALTIVAAAADRARRHKDKLTIEGMHPGLKHYLIQMGLASYLGLSLDAFTAHEDPPDAIPVTRINSREDIIKIIERSDALNIPTRHCPAIQLALDILMSNAVKHSGADAFVALRYYKRSKRVSVAVSDTGAGLHKKLGKHHHCPGGADAIHLALMPGISGTTAVSGGNARHGGNGLFMAKCLARIYGGFFLVYSGQSMYKLRRPDKKGQTEMLFTEPGLDWHTERQGTGRWQGTVVAIDISLNRPISFEQFTDQFIPVFRWQKQGHKRTPYYLNF